MSDAEFWWNALLAAPFYITAISAGLLFGDWLRRRH